MTRAQARRQEQSREAAPVAVGRVDGTSAGTIAVIVPETMDAAAQPVVDDGIVAQSTASEVAVASRATSSDVAAAPSADASTTSPAAPAGAAVPLTRRRARQRTAAVTPVLSTTVLQPERSASAQLHSTALPMTVAPATDLPRAVVPAAASATVSPATVTAPHATPDQAVPVPTADEFEEAVRRLSFTGPTQVRPEPRVDADESAPAPKAARPKRKHTAIKRLAAASLSFSAVVAVGLLTVGATLPAEAVASPSTHLVGAAGAQRAGDVSASASGEIQAYVAPADSGPAPTDLDRSANYTTARLAVMAGTTGISNLSNRVFTNNTACAVQWPFAVGVPISYGFGPRPGEFHTGVDFTPGRGAHIQAIADGVVRIATNSGGGYGVTVVLDHEIDGQHWASRYAHMEYGSIQVRVGQKVQVGEYLGRTGNTGFSFGAHTHFEILQNGVTPIDPLPWLRAHNKC
ncbi:hypothetical protein GCM10022240_17700 [Microbacterium kribbense]|uniref:M23ase beta-sheet core domain-containing protein n=1 Tax=Microbacterium kribbense TaxID=433645 RepID=A0ABP7GIY2_9MICO